jgi:adenylylsulfate kinase
VNRGAIAWFTGLPSAGKSTLAGLVRARLAAAGAPVVLLDGDEVRGALTPPPGYDPAARDAFYETLARLAALLAAQGLLVLVAATAPRRAHRALARSLAPRFVEVHVATPAAECRRRDTKGLWSAAEAGAAPHLPGVGTTYEAPEAPEVTATGGDTAGTVDEVAARLLQSPT